MTTALNATHDPKLRSWVALGQRSRHATSRSRTCPSAASRAAGSARPFRIGVAIGDQVPRPAAPRAWSTRGDMNALMAQRTGRARRCAPRSRRGLAEGSEQAGRLDEGAAAAVRRPRWPCPAASATTPTSTPASTTPTTIGKLFRPDQPLMPNYKWVPIGYHGRASSIGVSGQRLQAPAGPDQGARCRREPQLRPVRSGWTTNWSWASSSAAATRWASRSPSAEAEAHLFGVTPAQRLVGARHPGLGIPAAGPLPRRRTSRSHAARRGS